MADLNSMRREAEEWNTLGEYQKVWSDADSLGIFAPLEELQETLAIPIQIPGRKIVKVCLFFPSTQRFNR